VKTFRAVFAGLLLSAAPLSAADFAVGGSVGYDGGPVVRLFGTVDRFAKGLPVGLEASVGWTGIDPGNSTDVRRMFINDATNGTPEKNGWFADGRLDFTWDPRWIKEGELLLTGGARTSLYRGFFSYVGGNEQFEILSSQFGLGFGAEGRFAVSAQLDFVLQAGLDYYFDADLTGHDTTYSPTGDDVNPTHSYTYADVDPAVNQPKFVPSVLVGLAWRL